MSKESSGKQQQERKPRVADLLKRKYFVPSYGVVVEARTPEEAAAEAAPEKDETDK